DIKTSAAVYDHYELQLIAYWELYRRARKLSEVAALNIRLGVLHLNAKTRTHGKGEQVHGPGWQLVEVSNSKERLQDLWGACQAMWHAVNANTKPKSISYALSHQIKQQPQTIEP